MKKAILSQIIVCTFAAFTTLSAYAESTTSDSNATNSGSNTTAMHPGTDSQNMSTNASNLSDTNGNEDHNYGWIGLIGLAGLAGLMKKNHVDSRADINRVPNR